MMTPILYIIAILWIALGTFLIVFTDRTRDTLGRVFVVERIKVLSLLPLVFGALLIIGAFSSSDPFWFVFTLGIVGLAKGIYWVMAPPAQAKRLLDWWFSKATPETIRFWGLLAFVFGILLMACIQ
ncbi:MAG: hypothetical protein ACQEQ7_00695 [Thermodesulfobacteriota bacterium]